MDNSQPEYVDIPDELPLPNNWDKLSPDKQGECRIQIFALEQLKILMQYAPDVYCQKVLQNAITFTEGELRLVEDQPDMAQTVSTYQRETDEILNQDLAMDTETLSRMQQKRIGDGSPVSRTEIHRKISLTQDADAKENPQDTDERETLKGAMRDRNGSKSRKSKSTNENSGQTSTNLIEDLGITNNKKNDEFMEPQKKAKIPPIIISEQNRVKL